MRSKAMETRQIEAESGGRLDEVLALSACLTRSVAQRVIKSGVIVNGRPVDKPSFKVKTGDVIEYEPLPEKPLEVTPNSDIEVPVVYEDSSMIVFNKPRGLVVHTAPGHDSDTLVNLLVTMKDEFEFDRESMEGGRPGIVHRLDKDTSGLLIVAKTPDALRNLQGQLKDHRVKRTYVALALGEANEDRFTVDVPLLKPTHDQHRAVPSAKGNRAVTRFEKIWTRNGYTLLRCSLETGRTHQIRAHLAYIGLPVAGDPLYGKVSDPSFDRGQLLHAYRIEFTHPETGKDMALYAPMDDYMREAIDRVYSGS